ncbi:MAG: trypsin-like peptidase domain-containing protein, partial [Trebonia sp.]
MTEAWMAAAEASVLRVRGTSGGAIGVGVLIGMRAAVTCAHVVNAALGRSAREESAPSDVIIEVDFPLLGLVPTQASVTGWAPPPPAGDDIAVLTFLAQAPEGARPAKLRGGQPPPGTAVQMFGVPTVRPAGVWSAATVRGRVSGGR